MKQINNAIYGFAIADACGVPYEFFERDTFRCNKMIDCMPDSYHQVSCGTWSDDTSLLLCVLDALSEKEEQNIYGTFKFNCIEWMYKGHFTADNDFPFDIGHTCRQGIIAMHTNSINKEADSVYSNGNGGLMRILPIAFLNLKNDDEIMKYIKLFNANSHNHKISHDGCLIYIKLVMALLENKDIKAAISELKINEQYKSPEYDDIYNGKICNMHRDSISSSGYVVDTLKAVIWAILHSTNYKEAVFNAINLGNDTDTIAALVGGMAGIIYNGVPLDMKLKVKNKKLINATIKKFNDKYNK